VPLLLADVNVTSLEDLGGCAFTPANIPACLVERVGSLRGGGPVTTFAGNSTLAEGAAEYYYEDDVTATTPNTTCEWAGAGG
jgi:hypothetical protein